MPMIVVNTLDTAYVIDDEGHVLAGGERGEVDPGSSRVRFGIDSGQLLVAPEAAPAVAEPAVAAPAAAVTA